MMDSKKMGELGKSLLKDVCSLDFSHSINALMTEGGESLLIYFEGAAEDTRYELWVDGRGFSFGIPHGKMVRTERVDVVRRLLGYTDGLSREEMLGMLGEAEGLLR